MKNDRCGDIFYAIDRLYFSMRSDCRSRSCRGFMFFWQAVVGFGKRMEEIKKYP